VQRRSRSARCWRCALVSWPYEEGDVRGVAPEPFGELASRERTKRGVELQEGIGERNGQLELRKRVVKLALQGEIEPRKMVPSREHRTCKSLKSSRAGSLREVFKCLAVKDATRCQPSSQ